MEQLGRIIGENLKRLRADRGLSLSALAETSGVSKSRLGQIERGEANPSVTTVWQIANALRAEFSALVTSPQAGSAVVRGGDIEPVVADNGRYRAFALFPFDPAYGYEVFLSELDPACHLHAEPHGEGTWETVIVVSGRLSLEVCGETHDLGAEDAIRFRADSPHEYRNAGDVTAVCHIVITYPRVV
jgi:XRE family transcriptional regulator, regulator of sulfur utilization